MISSNGWQGGKSDRGKYKNLNKGGSVKKGGMPDIFYCLKYKADIVILKTIS